MELGSKQARGSSDGTWWLPAMIAYTVKSSVSALVALRVKTKEGGKRKGGDRKTPTSIRE